MTVDVPVALLVMTTVTTVCMVTVLSLHLKAITGPLVHYLKFQLKTRSTDQIFVAHRTSPLTTPCATTLAGPLCPPGSVRSVTGPGTEGTGYIPAPTIQHPACFQQPGQWYKIIVVVGGHYVE